MNISFCKYQGAGNDFILIDNRKMHLQLSATQVALLCHRHFGIGADGLMLLEEGEGADFCMRYFNADGHESSMCGNGGRCITAFALKLGIVRDEYRFRAIDGMHVSQLLRQNGREVIVRLQMKDVDEVQQRGADYFLDTGSPHVVRFVTDADAVDVFAEGRSVRYSEAYQPAGANVNFVQRTATGLYARTYERGVENETLACGTGVTASAIAATVAGNTGDNAAFTWDIKVPGGTLNVSFNRNKNTFTDVFLTGPTVLVFEGEISV